MKTKITILLALFTFSISAQNFSGKAIYKTSRKSTFKIDEKNNSGMSEEMTKQIQARMQKMNQKTFILNFDKKTSTYKEEVALKSPNPKANGVSFAVMSIGGSGNGSIYYKDINKKRYVNQTEIQGKRFLIKDKLPSYEWELSSETKNIGKYTCYKATQTKEVENVHMSMVNGKTVEEKKKETVVTTAWYTTEIPVSNGPGNFQGLPGLILEINDGKRLMVCTEIVMNSGDNVQINEPKKGKVVSQKKFNKIQKQKTDEMMEKFKGRNGIDLGNGINIKMGG